MGWFDFWNKKVEYQKMGNDHLYLRALSNDISRLEKTNTYAIARSLAEVWFPIDAIASRASSVPYVLKDVNDNIIEPKDNLKKLLTTPNPYSSFAQYVYDSVFFELATGNALNYAFVSELYKGKRVDYTTIQSLWQLSPNDTAMQLNSAVKNIFASTSEKDIVLYYETLSNGYKQRIEPQYVTHERLTFLNNIEGDTYSDSPLFSVEKNINNLLAVYAARFNIYENNGNAGILFRQAQNNSEQLSEAVNPITRNQMIDEALSRNGITGNKRVVGFSSVPLGWINTLATIKDLEPFREAKEDAIQIAGIYQVDKDLVPTADGATFENKRVAERNLYQNVIISVAEEKAKTLTQILGLDNGLRLVPDFSKVAVLQEDDKARMEKVAGYIEIYDKLLEKGIITDKEYRDKINTLLNE